MPNNAIGIDLGTTYSRVAFAWSKAGGEPKVISNNQGNRSTPSCVAFTENGSLNGEAAQYQMNRNPRNTIFDMKRIIGRRFSDPVVQAHKTKCDFDIVNDGGKTKIKVTENGRIRTLFPEEITGMELSYLKRTAEEYLGKKVDSAVITVPAYFNDSQQRATEDAAEIAGLHVLEMIDEPTAAALAYGLHKKFSSKANVLVFDLGRYTFDATLMSIEHDVHDVKATVSDPHLGGEDFNKNLYAHLVAEFKRMHHKDLTVSLRARYKLMEECEQVKKRLSAIVKTSVEIVELYDRIDLDCPVSRATFERLNEGLLDETMSSVDKVLMDANMKEHELYRVILIGGSTQIPFIQKALTRRFGEGKILQTIRPDEAVACGAAIHAASLSGAADV